MKNKMPSYSQLKRYIDVVASVSLLVVLSPLFIAVCGLLLIANRGGIFFTQTRIGYMALPFRIIKFKTMRDAYAADGTALPDAQRLTRVGRVIRKFSIDELPQLLNIMRGEMSFVGPRPLLPRYLPYYRDQERQRHLVRPGITGLAQVNGRNNLGWDERLAYDVMYVENLSFRMDLRILLKSIAAVTTASGVQVDSSSAALQDLDVERSE